MTPFLPPELSWLSQALLAVLALGLVLVLAVGALLVARPPLLFAINTRLSRWIDTSQRFRALEQPVQWERFFYRYHRTLGSLLIVGALYVLSRWAFSYERTALLAVLDPRLVHDGLDWIVAALEVLLVLMHALILVVGAVILLRPSLLKNLERHANEWHPGPSTARLDAIIGPLDRGFAIFPRISGLILLAAGTWCLAGLLPFLLQALGR